MIRPGFLTDQERDELCALARQGLGEMRVGRRANAVVLLNDGMNCESVAKVLLVDDDTVRAWQGVFTEHGIAGLRVFNYQGSQSHLSEAAEAELYDWIKATLPRSTRMIGAWIAEKHNVEYSKPGLLALLHRLKIEYRKPDLVSKKLDAEKQKTFIDYYENLLNGLGNDEAVVFVDAVHPTHQARAVGCWVPEGDNIAIAPSSGRDRVNIHGAVNLETGATQMLEVPAANAESTISLLEAILIAYPLMVMIHVFLDNARYHHAKLVREWLAQNGSRITLHFIPAYSPHLNPIERLWGAMHRVVTHNASYATFGEFKARMLGFLIEEVPKNWGTLRDSVTDNFRVIKPSEFRILN